MLHQDRDTDPSAPGTARPTPPVARRRGLTLLLTLAVAMGPVSTDIYLPSLPGIARDLETSKALAQLSLGVFIAGFAVMMVICGPVADRFGRRPTLIASLVVYVLASIACALAPTIEFLLAARFVQAIGACAGPVVGRAIVRDLYPPREAGRVLGIMASAMALAPMIGPFLGGQLELWLGWRSTFWLLALYGFGLALTLGFRLDETLREKRVGTLNPRELARTYAGLLSDRTYVGFLVVVSATFGALFAWITNASFVIIDHFGLAIDRFAIPFAVVILGYVLGALAGSRLGPRLGLARTTRAGAWIIAFAAAVLVAGEVTNLTGLIWVVLSMTLLFFGSGFSIPQGTAGALAPFPDRAGSAASFLGFTQMSFGFLIAAFCGLIFDGTPTPLLMAVCLSALIAIVALPLLSSRQTTGDVERSAAE